MTVQRLPGDPWLLAKDADLHFFLFSNVGAVRPMQFGAIPAKIYLARTAPRRRNDPAAREARARRAIEFDYPVDASPSVCRIAANAEVDT